MATVYKVAQASELRGGNPSTLGQGNYLAQALTLVLDISSTDTAQIQFPAALTLVGAQFIKMGAGVALDTVTLARGSDTLGIADASVAQYTNANVGLNCTYCSFDPASAHVLNVTANTATASGRLVLTFVR